MYLTNRFLLCMFALGLFNNSSALASTTEGGKMNDNSWNTHYFGRFEISLPRGSEVSADYKLFNENLELISKNGKSQIRNSVDQKVEELKRGRAIGTPTFYEKTVPLDNGSVLIISRLNKFRTFNVYLLTSKNTLYHMMANNISEEGLEGGIEKMRMLSNAIYFRPPQEAPPRDGFAIEAGYTMLDNDKFFETIYMGAQIAGHPGTYVSLLTKSILTQEDSLIKRFEQRQYDEAIGELVNSGAVKTLRKRERVVNNIKTEEVAVSARADGKQFYAFQIEYAGTIESNTRPYIALELGTHDKGSDFKTDEEALKFWDQVVDSLRPLP